MLEAILLRRATIVAGELECIAHQRTATHIDIADLCILAVLWTQYFKPLAVRVAGRIEEIAENRIALDACLERTTKTRLALVFVEAFLHMPNGRSRMNLVAACDAIHGALVFFVVVQRLGIERQMLGAFYEQIQLFVSVVQLD